MPEGLWLEKIRRQVRPLVHKGRGVRERWRRSRVIPRPDASNWHAEMASFPRWEGPCDGHTMVDFLGVQTACHYRPSFLATPEGGHRPALPGRDQNYLEYLSLLRSVQEARSTYQIIELGAGYGFWLVSAAQALKLKGQRDFHLMGVELLGMHFEWMHEHFLRNGLEPAQHRLINGAV
jgi:hypothetical protein